MKTSDEILREQGIIKWQRYFKRAMIAQANEALDDVMIEAGRAHSSVIDGATYSKIEVIINRIKSELK